MATKAAAKPATKTAKTTKQALKPLADAVKLKAPKAAPAKKTVAKPAVKNAVAKPVATKTAKTVAKPVAKTATKKPTTKTFAAVEFVARKATPGKAVYVFAETKRPVSGPWLFAHTHAALTILGMFDASRPAVPKKAVLAILGQRAVTYHTRTTQCFEETKDHNLRLTTLGINKFMDRPINAQMANLFVSLFLDGTCEGPLEAVKDQIYQVGLV